MLDLFKTTKIFGINAISDSRIKIISIIALIYFLIFASVTLFSMQPPRPGEIEKYQKDGSFAKRLEYAEKMGNYKVSSDLVKRKVAQMKALEEGKPFNPETFPYATGLPSSGNPKIFILLIDFPDYPHTNAESVFNSKVFGYGDADEMPYESLSEYYFRSSYGLLQIQGNVLPWYREAHNRGWYSSYEQMIEEALNYHNPTHNFAQYDNNSDGVIDYFSVIWTGPNTGWGTFWWAYCCGWGDPAYTIDGKSLRTYSWQWESNPPGGEFKPHVLIHETGHGLGLPDYYDYDDSVGTKGGLGGLDMMDGNWGDHNAFSKWLLEWNSPTVIGTSTTVQNILLRPSSSFKDCVIIMPGQTISQPFREYYVVQNRSQLGQETNDFFIPNNGLIIWHVDATLNVAHDNFQYNNSYTAHKLIRLMEADGKEEVEQNKIADAGDFYTQNQYLSPSSFPNSNYYSGSRTGVHILDVNPTLLFSYFRANFVISSLDLVSISEAVDNFILPWSYGGNQVWFGQKLTSLYGGDSAQSGLISNNQSSYIYTTVNGPGVISFYWKVSSELNGDYLEFSIDDVVQNSISGEVDWQMKSYNVSSGSHTAKWNYKKNASNFSGSDRAWVDRVRFEMGSLANGLDNYNLAWTTRGNAQWFYETSDYYYGGDAVQSGALSTSQVSILETSVSGPGTLSFYYKDSDVSMTGDLEFLIDGEYADWLSNTAWTKETYAIPVGQHILTWEYTQYSSTPDTVYMDYVVYSPVVSLGEAVDNTVPTWETYGNGFWYGQEQTYYYGYDSARSGSITHNQTSYLETSMVGPGMVSFYWRVSSELEYDYLEFWIDYKLKDKISGITYINPWSQRQYLLYPGSHTLQWCYIKDSSGSSGSDCGWVDKVVWTSAPSLGEALDNTSLTWYVTGDVDFMGQTLTSYYGGDAAISGNITDNQMSMLFTQVNGQGYVTFYWKASCESYWDYLGFWIDGTLQDKISGQIDWEQRSFPVSSGSHYLVWAYVKDSSFSDYSDCGWVDKVVYVQGYTFADSYFLYE